MCSNDQLRDEIRKVSDKLTKHEESEKESQKTLIMSQKANTEALNRLIDKTHNMVEAWEAAEGVIKFGSVVGRLVKWLSGFAVLGGILHWMGIHIPR